MTLLMSPEDIASLLKNEGSGVSQDAYDEANEPADIRQTRLQHLPAVLETCHNLWSSQSPTLDLVAQALGDGSRDVAWRLPFGDSGILQFFAKLLEIEGLRQGLYVHALRLVGNSCADTDENRARVVEGNLLAAVIGRLKDESLIPFTIPVLYNILVDYEPAQLAASNLKLNYYLINHLSSPYISNYAPFIPYFCKILALLITQDGEAAVADPRTVVLLLQLATALPYSNDADDFTALTSVAAAYLTAEVFHEDMLLEQHLTLLLGAYYHSHTGFQPSDFQDEETEASLKSCRAALLTSLSDLSANDAFPTLHPFGSAVYQTIFAWLRGPVIALVPAACIMLGNLSRSDEASTALVHTYSAHTPLVRLLSDPAISDPQTLHAALSFLKNLAIPSANKATLGSFLESNCVPRVCALDTLPQVQFSAISLTRLLLVNSPANVRRICSRLSTDVSSPSYDRSHVHGIISLFERSDAEPTKLEAARSIAAICRVLHSNSAADLIPEWNPEKLDGELTDDERRRNGFYSHHDLSATLAFLVVQAKWPILRSEAWFVFALMCRSKDGGGVVLSLMFNDEATSSLIQAVTGRSTTSAEVSPQPQAELNGPTAGSATVNMFPEAGGIQLEPQQVDPQQLASIAKIDRENAVVLCTEMLRHWSTEMPQLRVSMWQDLVKEGTELIVKERGGQLENI